MCNKREEAVSGNEREKKREERKTRVKPGSKIEREQPN